MGSDTKNRILDVASRLFEANGYEGTAVSAILREAGVNSGSLYHFFPNKEGLLVSVLEHHLAALDSLLTDAARAADDPVERVFTLLELYRGRLLVSGFTRGCPVGDLALEIGNRQPEAREIVGEYFSRWSERVCEWLDAAGDRIAVHVDRSELAWHVLSVMQGAVMQSRAALSIQPFDASVAQLRALMDVLSGAGDGGGRAARPRKVPPIAEAPRIPEEHAAPVELEVDRAQETGVSVDGPAWWRAW